MDRERVMQEVLELMARKLYRLPPYSAEPEPEPDDDFDAEAQRLVPDVTEDPLDIAEVVMDLEDAFDVLFDEVQPGDEGMETIGQVVDYIHARMQEQAAKAESDR